jgi:hypothetical protein
VLEGEYEFLIEGRTLMASAGALIYVPKGTLHTHNNMGEGVSRMLVTQTPGGLSEKFFEETGAARNRTIVLASCSTPEELQEDGGARAEVRDRISATYRRVVRLPP